MNVHKIATKIVAKGKTTYTVEQVSEVITGLCAIISNGELAKQELSKTQSNDTARRQLERQVSNGEAASERLQHFITGEKVVGKCVMGQDIPFEALKENPLRRINQKEMADVNKLRTPKSGAYHRFTTRQQLGAI